MCKIFHREAVKYQFGLEAGTYACDTAGTERQEMEGIDLHNEDK